MSITDGGSFKCYQHEEVFETTNPEEWDEHVNDGEHTTSGSSPCVICGKMTTYAHQPINKKAVCDDCKKDLK